MKFGPVAIAEALGAILAHSVKLDDERLPKGHVLTDHDLQRLAACGVGSVICARLEDNDVQEDSAAEDIAAGISAGHLRRSQATTGRVNFYATENGLFTADKAVVNRLNRIDPAITLACLADHSSVRSGDMVATVKIIPLAVSTSAVAAATELLAQHQPFAFKPFAARRVLLIATCLPQLKPSVMDKTRKVLEQRLALSGSKVVQEIRVPHHEDAVATAIIDHHESADLIVVFGASAMIDAGDVIPQAVRLAGGVVDRVGLPVDPGNLLVLGHLDKVPVIGAPGCARSPKENGFDWILNRLAAGEVPSDDDLSGLGVGGLLMEIPTRPRPRDAAAQDDRLQVGIVLLAAGQASRMGLGGPHKLLAEFDGTPLVRRMAEAARASSADAVCVVTGHRADEIGTALAGLDLKLAHNPDFATGMSSSLVAGFSALKDDVQGIMVMLADMPGVTTADLDAMIAAFRADHGQSIVRAVSNGKRGNPVILPAATFEAVLRLQGDIGARHIIEKSGLGIVDIDIGAAAHLDVDTQQAVIDAGGILKA